MKIAGIVAEYNPFHKGHRYQTEILREAGYEGVVAAMSGNFVQRADVAFTDKYRRAAAAVAGGVDLVIELPLPYAVASAEDFARGGVEILTSLGVIDTLCCGCESGDESNRKQYEALCLAEEKGLIREKIRRGLSYPAACKEAVRELGGAWSEEPNDVLALAYRKALKEASSSTPLVAIQRKGSYYGDGGEGFESASSIRKRIQKGEAWKDSLPDLAFEHLKNAPLADLTRLERGILAYYRTASAEELKGFYGMREGLAERICNASEAKDLADLYDRVKTKRFPHSAVRRAVLCGYLKIPKNLPKLSYLRVLAFNDRGQEILRQAKGKATLPICSGLTPQMHTDPATREMVDLQLNADEIFALSLPKAGPKRWDFLESARKIPQFGK